jgi:hypothetical protein
MLRVAKGLIRKLTALHTVVGFTCAYCFIDAWSIHKVKADGSVLLYQFEDQRLIPGLCCYQNDTIYFKVAN